jgi:hypothetical protein
MLVLLAGAAGCAPETAVMPALDLSDVHTVSGRFPARRHGILIAQNAALEKGRAMCQEQGKRFRPLGSVAGEDPGTGEAVYAVRFRCLPARGTLAPAPAPGPGERQM